MTTIKAGFLLTALGVVIILLAYFAGGEDRKLGAGQILGIEMGVAVLLCGVFLAWFYPERDIHIGNGIRTGLAWLFHLPVSAWVMLGFLIIYLFFFLTPVFFNPERSMFLVR